VNCTNVGISLLLGILMIGGGLSGCSAPSVKKTSDNSTLKTKPVVEHQLFIINQQAARKETATAKRVTGKKDKHHIEYEKKRLRYNQQWLTQQDARQQQLKQKYHDRYQAQQQQATRQQQQAQQQAEQQLKQEYHARYQAQQQQIAIQQQQAEQQLKQKYHARYQAQQQQAEQQRLRRQWQQQAQQRARAVYAKRQPSQHNRTVNLAEHLSNAAINRTRHRIRYDGRYIPISYPMGDVPANMGVCTDVIIRSYRSLGIDLQRLVHEDISRAFYAYPNLSKWGLSAPDPNIDHRRVHNLRAFFNRHAQRLPMTRNPRDYRPGDIVTWSLGGDQGHIGIVVNRRSPIDPNRYLIVHNISSGTKMEDVLFNWPITGHYRYFPNRQPWLAAAR